MAVIENPREQLRGKRSSWLTQRRRAIRKLTEFRDTFYCKQANKGEEIILGSLVTLLGAILSFVTGILLFFLNPLNSYMYQLANLVAFQGGYLRWKRYEERSNRNFEADKVGIYLECDNEMLQDIKEFCTDHKDECRGMFNLLSEMQQSNPLPKENNILAGDVSTIAASLAAFVAGCLQPKTSTAADAANRIKGEILQKISQSSEIMARMSGVANVLSIGVGVISFSIAVLEICDFQSEVTSSEKSKILEKVIEKMEDEAVKMESCRV